MRKLVFSLALIAAVAVAAAQPSLAQDTKFKVFAGASYISPLDDTDVDIGAVSDSIEASSELGWTAGFEWRFGKWLGAEIDVVSATHDIDFDGDKIAEIDITPVSVSLNFHVIHTRFIDLYVAPTASYVYLGDIEFDSGGPLNISDAKTDNEFAYGASVGLDVSLFKHFAIFGGVRWLSLEVSADDLDGDLGVDPLLCRLGVAFRI